MRQQEEINFLSLPFLYLLQGVFTVVTIVYLKKNLGCLK